MTTLQIKTGNITTLTLNRPSVHNAFNDKMIAELIEALHSIEKDGETRVLILKGNGKSFCAGADLNWMKGMAAYSEEENFADSKKLDELMYTLNAFPKPTIAVVHGNVYGGGVGLTACCDIALAEEGTKFSLSEAKLGLIPAVISPYVIQAIGTRQARRYFQTAEVFSAQKAASLGLVHELYVGEPGAVLEEITEALLQGGPNAQKEAKDLVDDVGNRAIDIGLRDDLAHRIAKIRVGEEAQDRLQKFLSK